MIEASVCAVVKKLCRVTLVKVLVFGLYWELTCIGTPKIVEMGEFVFFPATCLIFGVKSFSSILVAS